MVSTRSSSAKIAAAAAMGTEGIGLSRGQPNEKRHRPVRIKKQKDLFVETASMCQPEQVLNVFECVGVNRLKRLRQQQKETKVRIAALQEIVRVEKAKVQTIYTALASVDKVQAEEPLVRRNQEMQIPMSFLPDEKSFCKVYTAGYCTAAASGVGISFGLHHPRNASVPFPSPYIHNAEAAAATLACNVAKMNGVFNLHVHTSSKFLFNEEKKGIKRRKENRLGPIYDLRRAKWGMKMRWTCVGPNDDPELKAQVEEAFRLAHLATAK
ncbi:uncharacterized protein LOC135946194 [Cloeon dipterum]|uniref:uncharacterized protein LOC135946194 n=1 Tax=Cloeon dipterum TaxID=197152 RepID=UPI003220260D